MTLAMMETFRWYGPDDPVSLRYIKQCGCEGVMTSLHHIPYGEVWPRDEIKKRKLEVEAAGLKWESVESLPVHEDIKTRTNRFERFVENYKISLKNLGAESIETVIYNFMPVLDWVRTDMSHELEDGSRCLHFDPVRFAAFEIHLLKREGAEENYSSEQLKKAEEFFESMSDKERSCFEKTIIDVFPGCRLNLSIEDVREMLSRYSNIDRYRLKDHMKLFLKEVVPAAEEAGVRMAVHPDDPPYPILGLPRIVSCEEDIKDIVSFHDSPSNGVCFCTGSLSPRADNDLVEMIKRFGHRINALHLRNTKRLEDGCFYESNHLNGSVDMYGVIKAALNEMKKRKEAGRKDWKIAFRPDHGRVMLDDLNKPESFNPGYTCIGRMQGLAEIRGLQLGIARSCFGSSNQKE